MLNLRQSQSYFWNASKSSYLGRGAFGVVYKYHRYVCNADVTKEVIDHNYFKHIPVINPAKKFCVDNTIIHNAISTIRFEVEGTNKSTGESVAVKTFERSPMRPKEVQNQELAEFVVLKRLKHKNIVKLLAVEDDMDNSKKVIIMELCSGGSLLNILEDPENFYGVPEPEFLLILKHLCDGVKYLRNNNIVHRDLKPGNIMKFITEDGQIIYKLIDFGAAKELQENQSYDSLHGTPEYLHPNIFEKAFIKNTQQTFNGNVDLWSIGVTLYHLATGGLPFQPIGGRKNSKAMHFITSTKPAGVISGIQQEDGNIEWHRTLPIQCRFSEGLKSLLVPLLGGLLEKNHKKMWSFEHFFKEITIILNKIILHIFYMNQTSYIKLFLDPEDKFDVLQEHLKERKYYQTEILPQRPILLFGNDHFVRKVGTSTNAKDYPKTKKTNPIYLFCGTNNNIQLNCQTDLPVFPFFAEDVYPEKEAEVSTAACIVAYEYKRRIESFTTIDVLIKSGMEQFIETHKLTLNTLLRNVESFQDFLNTIMYLLDVMSYLGTDATKEIVEELNVLKIDCQTAHERIQQLHKRFLEEKLLLLQKLPIWDHQSPYEQKANERVTNLVQCLRQSNRFFIEDRHKKGLEYNEQQLHALEEIKFSTNVGRIKSLLNKSVQPNILKMIEVIADSYNLAQTLYVQADFLGIKIQEYQRKFEIIRETINPIMDKIKDERIESKKESFLDISKRKEVIDKLKLLCDEKKEFRIIEQKQKELEGEMLSYIKTDVNNIKFLD